MPLVRDFEDDPLSKRVVLLVFGPAKIGKTLTALNLVTESRDFVILISVDHGAFQVRQNPGAYKGRLLRSDADNLVELRRDFKEAKLTVQRLFKQKVDAARIWVVLDTVTHLQTSLMKEARKVAVRNESNELKQGSMGEEYLREMTIQVDYLVNLGHMAEVMDELLSFPCNVVLNALDKEESKRVGDKSVKTGRTVPSISGSQVTSRVLGDVDAILEIRELQDGARVFRTFVDGSTRGGDRSGRLDKFEPLDLKHVREKMLGLSDGARKITAPTEETEGSNSEEEKADQVTA